ncbi:MAG: ribonuclease P protein component 1 [Asgard group archaeon]|nr:ribonuclease P protein component 1 [Asgard group archaeon]
MNPITITNIHRHELIGLKVKIIKASDSTLVGTEGIILTETKNTFILAPPSGKTKGDTKTVLKKDCVFRFTLPSGKKVSVDGKLLQKTTENRLKNIIRKRW